MLATPLIHEIDRLLQQGELSHRKIAARLQVSRGTVSAIANGRRGLHGKDAEPGGDSARVVTSPPTRCPRCGYRIYEPCLVCCTRQHRERQRIMALPPTGCAV